MNEITAKLYAVHAYLKTLPQCSVVLQHLEDAIKACEEHGLKTAEAELAALKKRK